MEKSKKFKTVGMSMMLIGAYLMGVATGRAVDDYDKHYIDVEDEVVEGKVEGYAIDIKDLPEGAYVTGHDKYGNPLYNDANHEQIIEGYEVIEDGNEMR